MRGLADLPSLSGLGGLRSLGGDRKGLIILGDYSCLCCFGSVKIMFYKLTVVCVRWEDSVLQIDCIICSRDDIVLRLTGFNCC